MPAQDVPLGREAGPTGEREQWNSWRQIDSPRLEVFPGRRSWLVFFAAPGSASRASPVLLTEPQMSACASTRLAPELREKSATWLAGGLVSVAG